jgi:hypothetical protein
VRGNVPTLTSFPGRTSLQNAGLNEAWGGKIRYAYTRCVEYPQGPYNSCSIAVKVKHGARGQELSPRQYSGMSSFSSSMEYSGIFPVDAVIMKC